MLGRLTLGLIARQGVAEVDVHATEIDVLRPNHTEEQQARDDEDPIEASHHRVVPMIDVTFRGEYGHLRGYVADDHRVDPGECRDD